MFTKQMVVALLMMSFQISAQAEVLFKPQEVSPDTYQVLSFATIKSCNGAGTLALTVKLPEGWLNVTPRAKQGWTIETEQEQLTNPVYINGELVTQRTAAIRWSGAVIPTNQFDTFDLFVRVPKDAAGKVPFALIQECEGGSSVYWTRTAGKSGNTATARKREASSSTRSEQTERFAPVLLVRVPSAQNPCAKTSGKSPNCMGGNPVSPDLSRVLGHAPDAPDMNDESSVQRSFSGVPAADHPIAH